MSPSLWFAKRDSNRCSKKSVARLTLMHKLCRQIKWTMNLFALILVGIAAVIGVVLMLIMANFFGVWLRAKIADAPVPFAKLIGMRLRRVPVRLIVDSRITAVKAGLPLDTDSLEAHFLSGGNVTHVVLALIAAAKRASRSISIVPARSISPSKAPARPCWRLCARASIRRSSTAQILNSPADESRSMRSLATASGEGARARDRALEPRSPLAAPRKKPSLRAWAKAS